MKDSHRYRRRDPRVGFGDVLNQVQNVYNDFGQQTHSYQEPGGGVNLSTTPKVQYSYADGSTCNTIRMTGMPGNWKTFKQDNDGNGTWELNQTRTANKVNEITGSTPACVRMTESPWTTFTEAQWVALMENSGSIPQQLSARYEVWNRLVLITSGTQKISEHVHDARGYRIRRDTYTRGTPSEARRYY